MRRWCRGCGRQSISPRNSTVMASLMRSLRSSKLWVWREGRNFGWVQCPLKSSLFTHRIGVSVKQQFTEEEIYKDRDSQITAIEKTFEDAQKSVIEGRRWGEAEKGVASRAPYPPSHPVFVPTRSPSIIASPE